MAVTHDPAGFTGTVDQIDEARRFALGGGGRFRVNSSTDWALTPTGATRTVSIAAGAGIACGVYDTTTAADTVTFAANAGGSDRFDALVATFDWSAMTISFRVIQGTTVPPAIVRTGVTVDTTKINWLPGLRYDAVLGIIRARPGVTTLAPADLYDCRPWGDWRLLNVATASFRNQIDVDPGGRILDTATSALGARYLKLPDGTWVGENAEGKAWRTTGFSGSLTANTDTVVVMDASRVRGGVTASASGALTLPQDGMWRLVQRSYASGGPPPYDIAFYARRTRAAAADISVLTLPFNKETGQDRMPTQVDVVPLKAGDIIYAMVNAIATGPNYWGVSEVTGVMLAAYWEGPLNGVTPL
jgi:hypothetical protein